VMVVEVGTVVTMKVLSLKSLAAKSESVIAVKLSNKIISGLEDDNDSGSVGTLQLFAPSDTTFVKHFIATTNAHHFNEGTTVNRNMYIAGYFNTTTALTRVQFKMSDGDIDAGTISLYGIT